MPNSTTIKAAVSKITAERKRRKITQAAAAQVAGISQPSWARIERGEWEPTWETLRAMARAVGLRVRIEIERV